MAPDWKSHLTEILGRCTDVSVTEVAEDVATEPDRIYVTAPAEP